jgi:hypothetical protein
LHGPMEVAGVKISLWWWGDCFWSKRGVVNKRRSESRSLNKCLYNTGLNFMTQTSPTKS